ncbi:putative ATP-dependent protease [Comamonas testosteroni TK102]|uniref:Putative ATP-dependent protease n=1 Tax=Comamonas testosteroni TK102 TaxID=1392005 RepID=A0A076PQI5_COMTE|nr:MULTISPECIES: hypothetical protein [Comamonas]AIJ45950.1 putative ATP-dependent protease [Comamonas testosteroni TK102]MPS87241.1 hypothetical protein [Comamonas sp.]
MKTHISKYPDANKPSEDGWNPRDFIALIQGGSLAVLAESGVPDVAQGLVPTALWALLLLASRNVSPPYGPSGWNSRGLSMFLLPIPSGAEEY